MRLMFLALCLVLISGERLTADIYVESLCPYCINFIKNSLFQAINTPEIEKMVHIRLIPYGNTKRQVVNDKWVFTCQHGETECYGDLIELCVQNRVQQAFAPNNEIPLVSVIHCIENKVFKPYTNQQFDDAATACAINYKYDAADVITCANSEEGYKYHLQAAEETDRLSPPHLGVPWAVANRNYEDATADSILEDLVQWACDNYTGQKIDACYNKMQ